MLTHHLRSVNGKAICKRQGASDLLEAAVTPLSRPRLQIARISSQQVRHLGWWARESRRTGQSGYPADGYRYKVEQKAAWDRKVKQWRRDVEDAVRNIDSLSKQHPRRIVRLMQESLLSGNSLHAWNDWHRHDKTWESSSTNSTSRTCQHRSGAFSPPIQRDSQKPAKAPVTVIGSAPKLQYDPITGRMVQPSAEADRVAESRADAPATAARRIPLEASSTEQQSSSSPKESSKPDQQDHSSNLNVAATDSAESRSQQDHSSSGVSEAVKDDPLAAELRQYEDRVKPEKAKPVEEWIVPSAAKPPSSVQYDDRLSSALGDYERSHPDKPAPPPSEWLVQEQTVEQDLESLTAEDIRARMRSRVEHSAREVPAKLEPALDRYQAKSRAEIDGVQRSSQTSNSVGSYDSYGYTREPIGLQTSFAREIASGRSLEEELKERTEHLSGQPIGLQTSSARAFDSGDELKACATEPIRNENSSELPGPKEAKSNGQASAAEASSASVPEVCQESTGAPEEVEREALGGLVCSAPASQEVEEYNVKKPVLEDEHGYSMVPMGLETSFAREVAECREGKRKSLEDELKEAFAAIQKQSVIIEATYKSATATLSEVKAAVADITQTSAKVSDSAVKIYDLASRISAERVSAPPVEREMVCPARPAYLVLHEGEPGRITKRLEDADPQLHAPPEGEILVQDALETLAHPLVFLEHMPPDGTIIKATGDTLVYKDAQLMSWRWLPRTELSSILARRAKKLEDQQQYEKRRELRAAQRELELLRARKKIEAARPTSAKGGKVKYDKPLIFGAAFVAGTGLATAAYVLGALTEATTKSIGG